MAGLAMPTPDTNPELMRSLGRLVRGLSALFWGLPVALIVCFHTAKSDSFKGFGILPPLLCTGWLVYGLLQLGFFQPQERVWQSALDRARVLGVILFGLCPFLYWSNRVPGNLFFFVMTLLMSMAALLFLGSLNVVLQRLGAMLPDEALRHEVKQFTLVNLNLLAVTIFLAIVLLALHYLDRYEVPVWVHVAGQIASQGSLWVLLILVLLPLAMTMALVWKTKEVILDSVFSAPA